MLSALKGSGCQTRIKLFKDNSYKSKQRSRGEFGQQPWKKTARNKNLLFMDPINPQSGWSWLERYMAGRPLGTQRDKDHKSVKNGINITRLEIAKSYTSRQLSSTLVASRKFKCGPSHKRQGPNDDSKSIFSIQSEMNKRHSIVSYSVRDDESMYSSTSVPSYMMQTKSEKAKSKGQSLLGPIENGSTEKEFGPKKRLSFPGPPARPRCHSGPPRIQSSSFTNFDLSRRSILQSMNSATELKEVFLSACGLLINGQRELKLA
ncbi:hypothetical protein Tco_0739508 [Tanacetum coccineum]